MKEREQGITPERLNGKLLGTELNADHVKVVMARWPHETEREALQYLYPKEVQYLWIKGQIGNNQ